MEPGDVMFYAYSDASKSDIRSRKKTSRLVETDIDDIKELETMLYNAGFFYGYLDGKPYRISKQRVYYYDRNPNEIAYAQYLLTKDKKYLELIKKPKLYTLCRIEGTSMFFPTTKNDADEKIVLAYTDRARMPKELREKYAGWRNVRMTFDAKCMVNGEFVLE